METYVREDFYAPDDETNILYEEGSPDKIKGATLCKLIAKLTAGHEGDVNMASLLHDFLLTYRSFTTAPKLLDALITRFRMAENDADKEMKVIQLRVYTVLQSWIKNYWYDFSKDCPALADKVKQFLSSIDTPAARAVLQKINKMLSGENSTPQACETEKPEPIVPKNVATCTIVDLSPKEIARQLTLIEWRMWKEIQPWECLGLAWTKKDKNLQSPHVMEMINRFNYVSGWVASSICTQERLKDRSRLILKLVEVAMELQKMSNFNGVMEIISGINRAPVYRLTETWKMVQQRASLAKGLQELRELTDNSKSYSKLRQAIREANPPCIPYLGVYLTDLTFIEEGNKDFIGEKCELINFFKRRLISEKIKEIQTYQHQAYVLDDVLPIQQKLIGQPIITDDGDLQEMSLYLEPRPGQERGPRPPGIGGSIPKKTNSKIQKFGPEFLEFKKEWIDFYVADSPTNLNLNGNTIISGTLPKIVERLTHHAEPDNNSLLPFLVMLRTVTTPKEFLNLLISRSGVPAPKDKSEESLQNYKQKFQTPILLRVLNVIKNWITYHWYDFEEDSELKETLTSFINNLSLVPNTQVHTGNINSLIQNYEKKKTEQSEKSHQSEDPEIIIPVPADQVLFNFPPQDVAHEITYRIRKLFEKIRPEEILSKSDPKISDKSIPCPYLDKFRNFSEILEKFTNYEITMGIQKGNLSQVITHLLYVARYCAEMNNLEGLARILTPLDRMLNGTECVQKAWARVNPQDLAFFKENKGFTSASGRRKMSEKIKELKPPGIPIIEVFIHLCTEAYRKISNDGPGDGTSLISMENKRLVGDILVNLVRNQKTETKFRPVRTVHTYMRERRQTAETTPPIGTANSENSESEQTPNTLSDSFSNSTDTRGDISPNVRNFNFPSKAIFRGFKELTVNDTPFRADLSNFVKDVFCLELPQLRLELKKQLQSTPSAILPPRPSDEDPLFVGPTPLTAIRDIKVRTVISKAFPGSQLMTWHHHDAEGQVDGSPELIEVDVIQKETSYYLLDVKEKVGIEEIAAVLRVGKLFHGLYPEVSLGCVMVTPKITKQASLVADACKIKLLITK